MSGNCNADTCNLKAYRLSATISSLGCPQSSTEHEFNRAKTHDSYTTHWGTILLYLHLSSTSSCGGCSNETRRRVILHYGGLCKNRSTLLTVLSKSLPFL